MLSTKNTTLLTMDLPICLTIQYVTGADIHEYYIMRQAIETH